jgi:catechol 2,3-dioxygenase-like lactoylglutathione lyase family enzyme
LSGLVLDHLVIAVRDLAVATDNYVRLFGRRPSWRGRHPVYGTANALFRLDNTYIELLAPDHDPAFAKLKPDKHPAWRRALVDHLDTAGEGLYALALGTDDIDAAVAAARAAGLEVADPLAGDGVDLQSGARREWRNARIAPESTRGVRAFFIQHGSPPDALPPAKSIVAGGAVTGVDHVVVTSSHLDATLAVWRDALGVDLRRTFDWSPKRRLCFLKLAGIILEIAGEPSPAEPGARDLLWGVSYRCDSVPALVERLRRERIDVSDARTGRAENTVVADLKPGFSHDVRTLFIEHASP